MRANKIHWLGHASIRIEGEVTIYIDPWKLKSGEVKADIILITHS
ncbi:MAG: MBL fold metallo-hydrolase, partial [Elusimicrobiota bacterium]|nr:MBL fold metallo-hydrolase [Elusimicrobiota bacterium]